MPRLRAASRRVADVLRRAAPVTEPPAPAALPGPPYDLAARGLTAGWAPGRAVLRDVWFDIPAGSRAAVVGPSGSGKTTLAMVLLRFLDYSGGAVTLAGRDLRTLDSDFSDSALSYAAVGGISRGTIIDNPDLGRDGAPVAAAPH